VPTFNRHGGVIRQGFRLTVSSEQGIVSYTTDGTDHRNRFSGEVAESAKPYVKVESMVLTESTLVKMRALYLGWSALTSAQFRVVSDLGVSEFPGS
jgi:hypothetical protein